MTNQDEVAGLSEPGRERSLGDRARDALSRHAWTEAWELLSAADSTSSLAPDELELLATASWWVGKLGDAIEARERAYGSYVKAGDRVRAAAVAAALGQDNLLRGTYPVATAWLNRADHHLQGLDDTPAHGWLEVTRAFEASLQGRYDEVLAASERAQRYATMFEDPNLATLALSCEGLARIHRGEIELGLAQVDEATIAAVGGEIEPATAGGVCCSTIEACASLGDWKRAAQWTEAQDRWCKREHINGFPGMCRVFRSEIKRLQGDWLAAESEARRASDELAGFIPGAVGVAQYEIGMIRMRRGDLVAAEQAFMRAHDLGRDPEPGLSLLRLAQGRTIEAATSIRRAVDEPDRTPTWASPPGSPLGRLELLPAQVEIALAIGDLPTARVAADELRRLAATYPSTTSSARDAMATGTVLLAEGEALAASRELRRAVESWTELGAPYDAARAREALAEAYAATEDSGRAALERRAARGTFDALGAVLDVRRVDREHPTLAGAEGSHKASGDEPVVSRVFVFTDIVDSTRLGEALGDDAWRAIGRWHDRTIRSIVAEHAGEEIKATGDGFFLAFAEVDDAVEAAVAIQRRFREQRSSEGFVPLLRIGLHEAEARQVGLDYAGGGVNIAARVASAASGDEVLVSAATIAHARRAFRERERRSLALKGVSSPVDVVSIDWA